jgi:hypothetical protein
MHKQEDSASAHERSECVGALHRSKRRHQPEFGKSMHKQEDSASAHEGSECVGALEPFAEHHGQRQHGEADEPNPEIKDIRHEKTRPQNTIQSRNKPIAG